MADIGITEPDRLLDVREVFGIDSDLKVPAFSERDDHVPEIDPVYRFNPDVTLALLAGFMRDRRVMVQGYHGTGKSTHIEQVASRLNWPCIRVNLDSHISRIDLVGKDAIVLKDMPELLALLPKLIAATESGELDPQIAAVSKRQAAIAKR